MAKQENPLTIQSFHQCASLISIKLNGSNYLLWKSQVLPLVRTLGLEEHITKEAPAIKASTEKSEDSTGDSQSSTWINNDGLLTSWLLGIIAEDVLASLEGIDSAYKVWKSLEDSLLTMTKENEIHLNESLLTLKKGNSSVEEYIRKFKAICDKLAALKKPLDDLTKVFHLARGLGSKYKDFSIAMLSKPPYPSYNHFVLALKMHEQLLLVEEEEEKSNQITINQAFFSNRGRSRGRGRHFSSRGRGFPHSKHTSYKNQGNFQHHTSLSPTDSNIAGQKNTSELKQDGNVTCQICGRQNHTAMDCWNRFDHAYQSEEVSKALAALNLTEAMDPNIFADSGPTSHIVNDPGKVQFIQPYCGPEKMFVGNGEGLKITHTGHANFKTKTGQLALNNVLVVPEMKTNLLSISKLTRDNNCSISFFADKLVIKNAQRQTIAEGYQRKGLYELGKLQSAPSNYYSAFITSKSLNKAPISIWHQRMGHLNDSSLRLLSERKLINVSNWKKEPNLCTSCQLGKSCKLPFQTNENLCSKPLEKIHCVLWGPAPVLSCQHFKYYASFVDDYSRYVWLYPMKKKSDFFDCFSKFQCLVENQFERKIKIFQSDGGGEFHSLALKQLFDKKGIHH